MVEAVDAESAGAEGVMEYYIREEDRVEEKFDLGDKVLRESLKSDKLEVTLSVLLNEMAENLPSESLPHEPSGNRITVPDDL